ncbi:MAG TPA: GNAT family N-acetyltransferase [Gemmatimonadaceae bacterium]|nr:GNAT family N-acetyltransferase [Gemmatimonadaceae bacterium]
MSQQSQTLSDETFTFKVATEPSEFEQIYRLNYRTFVEEIPQHAPNGDGLLVDKFDRENTYFICRRGDRVVGMMALRTKRPFSLDSKLENLDSYLPKGRRPCEVRLLAVEPEHRTGVVMTGLLRALGEYGIKAGYDTGVISATVRQIKLYRHMGFVPFGPLVGTPDAPYQPMYVTRESFAFVVRIGQERGLGELNGSASVAKNGGTTTREGNNHVVAKRGAAEQESFLPGPVPSHPDVWAAFTRPPVSHRHPDFASDLSTTQRMLTSLVHAERVQLLVGSGTLANDAIAAQLTLLDEPGVVLTNGEFGDRLVDHAMRAGLKHTVVRAEWGDVLPMDAVARALAQLPPGAWCWMVHCETSSGILNDLQGVADLCKKHSVRLAADCVSSLATVPLNLRDVYLASGVSGKAVAALPGLSMVFHHHEIKPSDRLPRYLDLGYYAEKHSVPFTHSSNLLAALRVATERTTRRAPFSDVADLGQWLRRRLRDLSFNVVAPDAHAAPAVVSLAIPGTGKGTAFGDRMADAGYELSYRSEYLRRRDWVQIALMGDCNKERLERLLGVLKRVYGEIVA